MGLDVERAIELVRVRLDKITDVFEQPDFVDISGVRGGDPVVFRVRYMDGSYQVTVR